MNSKDYIVGFAVGLLFVAFIFFIVWKIKGAASLKGEYDERQELVRGRGYKYALFAVMGVLALYMITEAWAGALPVPGSVIAFTTILIGAIVYALYCMKNGAFFGVNNSYKAYRIILILVVLTNGISAFLHVRAGELIVNGQLTLGPSMQILAVLGFAIVWIAMEVQIRRDREEAADEES